MPTVHLLNVSPGDCTIIQHASGRVTMMDICGGNDALTESTNKSPAMILAKSSAGGNFRMCESTINPLSYLKEIGIGDIFRFILSHPDMDHMDGFDKLRDNHSIVNFWDTGSRRDKPDFGYGGYLEEDWDRYVKVRDGKEPGTLTAIRQAGDRFSYANQNGEDGTVDGLHILAPDTNLIKDPNLEDDINEGSYVILYRSAGGKVLLPGDAHDAAWDYIAKNHAADVAGCKFMLAPHHGRDSGRSYDFLDLVKPKLTLLGCSPSKYIDYSQWSRRGLDYITSNQAGTVVLDIGTDFINVYIENEKYAKACGKDTTIKNAQGFTYFGTL